MMTSTKFLQYRIRTRLVCTTITTRLVSCPILKLFDGHRPEPGQDHVGSNYWPKKCLRPNFLLGISENQVGSNDFVKTNYHFSSSFSGKILIGNIKKCLQATEAVLSEQLNLKKVFIWANLYLPHFLECNVCIMSAFLVIPTTSNIPMERKCE